MTFAFLRSYDSRYFIGAIVSGLLLSMAFPPLEYNSLAWVAFIPLLFVLKEMPLRQAFGWGWLSGLAFWMLSVAWLLRLAITGTNILVALSAWFSLSAYCALYTGAFSFVAAFIWQMIGVDRQWRNIWLVLILPAVWVGFEYLRSTLFTGFAWNALGICQYRQLPIIQVAEFGGVYVVSALLMMGNTALMLIGIRFYAMFRRDTNIRKLNVELMILLVFLSACMWKYFEVRKLVSLNENKCSFVRIASVQPNIPQYKKWPLQYEKEIYTRLREQTLPAIAAMPDLIVWPETVVPSLVKRDPECSAFVSDLAGLGVPILVGSLDCEITADRDVFYNSSILIMTNGTVAGQYNKRHLVLFGEYLPFEHTFKFIQKMAPLGYSCTPGTTSTVFRREKKGIKFSALICFEDTVASLARESVRNGARLLINQTNDAWFDGSSAHVQHMAHCVFRCIENRVPAIRSANTGVTCFIDTLGRLDILEKNGMHREFADYVTGKIQIPPDDMRLTVYTLFGDLPFAVPCGIAAVFLLGWAVLTVKKCDV